MWPPKAKRPIHDFPPTRDSQRECRRYGAECSSYQPGHDVSAGLLSFTGMDRAFCRAGKTRGIRCGCLFFVQNKSLALFLSHFLHEKTGKGGQRWDTLKPITSMVYRICPTVPPVPPRFCIYSPTHVVKNTDLFCTTHELLSFPPMNIRGFFRYQDSQSRRNPE